MGDDFDKLVGNWKIAARKAADSENFYRCCKAAAIVQSQAKTESGRNAESDLATKDAREIRDRDSIEAEAALWLLKYATRDK